MYHIHSVTPAGHPHVEEFKTLAAVVAAISGIAQIRTITKVTHLYGPLYESEQVAVANAIGRVRKVFDTGIVKP